MSLQKITQTSITKHQVVKKNLYFKLYLLSVQLQQKVNFYVAQAVINKCCVIALTINGECNSFLRLSAQEGVIGQTGVVP